MQTLRQRWGLNNIKKVYESFHWTGVYGCVKYFCMNNWSIVWVYNYNMYSSICTNLISQKSKSLTIYTYMTMFYFSTTLFQSRINFYYIFSLLIYIILINITISTFHIFFICDLIMKFLLVVIITNLFIVAFLFS